MAAQVCQLKNCLKNKLCVNMISFYPEITIFQKSFVKA
jgi:hypothetical protein